jgi:N-dimethylarginine dimethylaminohydrolase
MPKSFLLCPPVFFDVIDQKNPHMSGKSPVDRKLAKQQWQAFRSALEKAGCKVEIIDPQPGMEDMVFAANQVFVGFREGVGRFIVPSRMVHPSRRREVPFYVDWFRQHNFKVIEINLDSDYLEGHGDLVWHPNWSRIYAGHGFRSTRGGIEKFSEAMAKIQVEVVPLQLGDPLCYHLDTCFCPLNDQAVLIYPGAFSDESLGTLHSFWERTHELTAEEAHQFMGNGIVVKGDYLTPRITPRLQAVLFMEKLRPVVLDTSEFEKSGGSLFCMKTLLP